MCVWYGQMVNMERVVVDSAGLHRLQSTSTTAHQHKLHQGRTGHRSTFLVTAVMFKDDNMSILSSSAMARGPAPMSTLFKGCGLAKQSCC